MESPSQDWIGWLLLGALVLGLVFAYLGAWVAGQKHRNATEGAVLGLVFGPFGVIVEGLLPTLEPAKRPAPAQVASKSAPPLAAKPKPLQAEEWMPQFPEERTPGTKGKG
jgi:hypothetical protein